MVLTSFVRSLFMANRREEDMHVVRVLNGVVVSFTSSLSIRRSDGTKSDDEEASGPSVQSNDLSILLFVLRNLSLSQDRRQVGEPSQPSPFFVVDPVKQRKFL